MSKDMLKEYFSQRKELNTEPRHDFEKELIETLKKRIEQIETRRRWYSILGIISLIILTCVAISRYVSLDGLKSISSFSSNLNASNLIMVSLLFTIIFIASYQISTLEIRSLRRQIKEMKSK
ncbi:MAG: hypothetical protein SNG49_08065 [Rikenellaceae bacterium]